MSIEKLLEDPEFAAWYESRPEVIQKMIEATPPNQLYEMKMNVRGCKTVYQIESYEEDGTLTMSRVPEYSSLPFAYSVFGIYPNDLVVFDIPETH